MTTISPSERRYRAMTVEERYDAHKAEADRIAKLIEAYWAERGHTVNTRIFDGDYDDSVRTTPSHIGSDMVNGWPRGYGRSVDA